MDNNDTRYVLRAHIKTQLEAAGDTIVVLADDMPMDWLSQMYPELFVYGQRTEDIFTLFDAMYRGDMVGKLESAYSWLYLYKNGWLRACFEVQRSLKNSMDVATYNFLLSIFDDAFWPLTKEAPAMELSFSKDLFAMILWGLVFKEHLTEENYDIMLTPAHNIYGDFTQGLNVSPVKESGKYLQYYMDQPSILNSEWPRFPA